MTKNEIIKLLQSLKHKQIEFIYVVYHNPKIGLLCMDTDSVIVEYARFKMSLYRLRKDIKFVCVDYRIGIDMLSVVYSDDKFPVSLSLYSYLKLKNK